MKKSILWLTLSAITLGLSACAGQKDNKEEEKERKGWELVWEDDFDQSPVTANWAKTPRNKKSAVFRYVSQNEGLYVSQDGNLVLRAMANTVSNDTLPFLTGGINRPAYKAGTINRIEVRARMNTVDGAIPYITLIPLNTTDKISIDFMERYGLTSSFTSRSPQNIPLHWECPIIHLQVHL